MCFSLAALITWLVWLVIICAVIAILRLLVPWIAGLFGVTEFSILVRVVNIIITAIVIVALLWFIYDLLMCAAVVPRLR